MAIPRAERVREALADDPAPAEDGVDGSEPESRLILETPCRHQPADYLPLFVAPQPVERAAADVDDDDEDDVDDEDDSQDSDDEEAERPAARRRRRGRRGRGRGRGEQNGDDSGDGESDSADSQSDADSADESDEDGDDESRRRLRAPPAAVGAVVAANPAPGTITTLSPDDPPNTVVHERAPRSNKDKVRRRDPGHHRFDPAGGQAPAPARRPRRGTPPSAHPERGRVPGPPRSRRARDGGARQGPQRPPHEGARYTQIAVLEDGVLVEHFVTSAASASLVGNVYLGIVQNVLPSMEAAFVDIGRGRNGVLYAGEVNWEAAGLGGASRKIEQALKPGDYVVVQVSKDPVGHKGARLTTQVSLAGRYLVYVPGASSTGISRKLPDTERQRLKEILREVVPADAGVIIRTASEGVKEEDIRADVNRLQERWTQIDATRRRDQSEGRRRRGGALRRARRAGQGHPRPVQRGLLRADRVR